MNQSRVGTSSMPRESIQRRIIWLYAVLTVVVAALFVFVVFENQLELINNNAILRSQLSGERLRRILQDEVTESTESLSAAVETEAQILGIEAITILSESGELLYWYPEGHRSANEQIPTSEFRLLNEALARREFENRLFHHELDSEARQVHLYIPIELDQGETYVAHAVVGLPAIAQSISHLTRQVVVVVVLVLLVNTIFWVLLWRLLFRPLNHLHLGIRDISSGQLEKELTVERNNELGDLALAFNRMTVSLRTMQEKARGANPLTGLPGNVEIAEEIDQRLSRGDVFAVLYGDLDNFKAYNDAYGFTQGDKGILYTRDVLERARSQTADAGEADPDSIFLGHEGGDDFVALCPYQCWERFAKRITRAFDAGVAQFYSEEDRERGYISSVDRLGNPQQFPFMSISLAVVTNHHRTFAHHAELVEIAAEVKKVAKKIPGSSFAIDRRKPEYEVLQRERA